MNEETAVLKEVKLILPHCSARTSSGRRRRMAISDPQSGRCFRHAAVRRPKRDDDISSERAMVNRWAERSARAVTPVEHDGYDSWSSNLEKSK